MGEIADDMLNGTLDCETGEYLGEENLEVYGTTSPGFPISRRQERETGRKAHEEGYYPEDNSLKDNSLKLGGLKVKCPICQKTFKVSGISDHCRNQHGAT